MHDNLTVGLKAQCIYTIECFGPDGKLKWKDTAKNIVVNVGLDEILDKFWKGSGYTAAHFVGLTDDAPTTAAADTMPSHAGWTEVTIYDEGTREALVLGSVSSQSVDNSASKASFAINATDVIGGAFIAISSTKGETASILMSVAAFTEGDKNVDNGDTLNVTATITAATV